MLFFAGQKPPRRLAKGRPDVAVGGCGCGKTRRAAAVMAALGMTAAAAMHGGRQSALTAAHMKEEEAVLFPALRAIDAEGTKKDIVRLLADHAVYKPLVANGLAIPTGNSPHSIDAHAALEDAIIERYADELLALASHSGPSVSGSVDLHPTWPSSRARIFAAIGTALATGAAIGRLL